MYVGSCLGEPFKQCSSLMEKILSLSVLPMSTPSISSRHAIRKFSIWWRKTALHDLFLRTSKPAKVFITLHLDAPKPDWQIPILWGLLLDELHLFCNWSIGFLHKFHLHFLPCNHCAGVTAPPKKRHQTHPSRITFHSVGSPPRHPLQNGWPPGNDSTLEWFDHQFYVSSIQTAYRICLLCLDVIVEVKNHIHCMETNDTL